jgi:putative FmdB family regulatory protein
MPIYGYACEACGHTLDALQKMSDPPLSECPECGKPALRRQLSAPRFRLKGQGWYETDFKSDKQRNLAGDAEASKAEPASDGKAEPVTGKKDEGKPDAAAGKKAGDGVDKAAKKKKSEKKPAKGSSGDTAGTA